MVASLTQFEIKHIIIAYRKLSDKAKDELPDQWNGNRVLPNILTGRLKHSVSSPNYRSTVLGATGHKAPIALHGSTQVGRQAWEPVTRLLIGIVNISIGDTSDVRAGCNGTNMLTGSKLTTIKVWYIFSVRDIMVATSGGWIKILPLFCAEKASTSSPSPI